jgi:hypothetical protein
VNSRLSSEIRTVRASLEKEAQIDIGSKASLKIANSLLMFKVFFLG